MDISRPIVTLGEPEVIQDAKPYVLYTFQFEIGIITHTLKARFSALLDGHERLMKHSFMRSREISFPPKRWFQNMSKRDKYSERARELLVYFHRLLSFSGIVTIPPFQDMIQLDLHERATIQQSYETEPPPKVERLRITSNGGFSKSTAGLPKEFLQTLTDIAERDMLDIAQVAPADEKALYGSGLHVRSSVLPSPTAFSAPQTANKDIIATLSEPFPKEELDLILSVSNSMSEILSTESQADVDTFQENLS